MSSETWYGTDHSVYVDGAARRADEEPDHYLQFPPFAELVGKEETSLLEAYPSFVAQVLVQYVRQVGASRSARIAIHHLANDLLSLFNEVMDYDGRAAARTARAIFESAVNVAEVVASPELGRRYLSHESVVMVQIAEHRLGLALLEDTEAGQEEGRLEAILQEHSPRRQAAVDEFGPRFEKEWHPTNLRERCRFLGWEERYRGYQILSAIMHGSAGGLLGNRRVTEHDTILRLGRSLEVIPVALLESLQSVDALFRHIRRTWPDFDSATADAVLEATSDLVNIWPTLRLALLDLDDSLWPEVGPSDPVAVLGLFPGGKQRWYWHDPMHEVIAVAEPPSDEQLAEHRELIDKLLAQIPADVGGYNQRPLTVALLGLRIAPKAGAVFAPAGSILSPRGAPGYEAFEEPRLIELDQPGVDR